MPTTKGPMKKNLPGRFEELVQFMPPQAIMDDVHYENTLEIVNRLMATAKLTKGKPSISKRWCNWSRPMKRSATPLTPPTSADWLR